MFPSRTHISRLRLIGSLCLCVLFLALGTGSGETFADEPAPLVKVLVTYHSLSGNTERMAEAVVDGVKSVSGAEARLFPCVVLASLRGSPYRSVRLASSLAAALLDGLFEHPETIVTLAP